MGLKIQKAANAHDPHARGIEGSNGHFFRAEPGRAQGAERRDALVIEPGASLQTRAAVRQQRFGFQRKAVNMLGANQVIRMLRRELIAVRFVHQIQRTRREVQGALAPGDNGAAQPLLRELDAAEQACQPAPTITVSNFIALLLLKTAKPLVDPAGKFAFAQGIAPGDRLNAFPALV